MGKSTEKNLRIHLSDSVDFSRRFFPVDLGKFTEKNLRTIKSPLTYCFKLLLLEIHYVLGYLIQKTHFLGRPFIGTTRTPEVAIR